MESLDVRKVSGIHQDLGGWYGVAMLISMPTPARDLIQDTPIGLQLNRGVDYRFSVVSYPLTLCAKSSQE